MQGRLGSCAHAGYHQYYTAPGVDLKVVVVVNLFLHYLAAYGRLVQSELFGTKTQSTFTLDNGLNCLKFCESVCFPVSVGQFILLVFVINVGDFYTNTNNIEHKHLLSYECQVKYSHPVFSCR